MQTVVIYDPNNKNWQSGLYDPAIYHLQGAHFKYNDISSMKIKKKTYHISFDQKEVVIAILISTILQSNENYPRHRKTSHNNSQSIRKI